MTLPLIQTDGTLPLAPHRDGVLRRFWDELEEGRLTSTQCRDCGHLSYPPAALCPKCLHQDLSWVTLPETGSLYSQTTIYRGAGAWDKETPYRIAIIDLDDGPRVLTRLEGDSACPPGTRLQLVVLVLGNGLLLAARPLSPDAH